MSAAAGLQGPSFVTAVQVHQPFQLPDSEMEVVPQRR